MKDDKRLKRKVRNSYLVSTISMALVLFLLGSVGYLMLAAGEVASQYQRAIRSIGGCLSGLLPDGRLQDIVDGKIEKKLYC